MTRTVHRVSRRIGEHDLILESGKMATQAHGAVTVYYGDSVGFAAVVEGPEDARFDFFPLTVDYREKTSAAGRIPGGFFKREGRPTTKETLTCRLIDRPLRPLFSEGYRREVTVSAMTFSADKERDLDVPCMNASAAALHISHLPFAGPIGAVRVGLVEGQFKLFPTIAEQEGGDLDLVVAGSKDAILMVEAGARELPEERMIEALKVAHEAIRQVCEMQEELRERCGRPKASYPAPARDEALYQEVRGRQWDRLYELNQTRGKQARADALKAWTDAVLADYCPPGQDPATLAHKPADVKAVLGRLKGEVTRALILAGGRTDGRAHDQVRPIDIEVGFLPRTHGSALFTRGETQAVVTVTLGTASDEQKIEGLRDEVWKSFLLHYNFPAFSVGESWPNRGPKRREIGHGVLAERALQGVLPPPEVFPYTIRIVSDIMESNGSSSMATVCGGTLALMDAACPIRQPVAGIAMGLVKEGDRVRILSDILGSEDHDGDMDFKVAGSGRGITALQMDIKVGGLTLDVMNTALEQARRGRIHILQEMLKALPRPRPEISPYAPAMERIQINPEKIGMLIGPSGKNIRKLQQDFHCVINVEDDGTVQISSVDRAAVLECKALIQAQTAEVEKGRTYTGRVTSIKDFGAFVEILPGQEGLLHISEISTGYVERVGDHVRVGDEVTVKVLDIDAQNRIRLSRKALQEGGGEGEEATIPVDGPGPDDRGPGRDSRGRGRRDGARHGR